MQGSGTGKDPGLTKHTWFSPTQQELTSSAGCDQSLYRGHAVRKRVADGKRQAEEERRERAAVMIQRRHRGRQVCFHDDISSAQRENV